MARGTSVADPELPVKLSDEEIQERALSMSGKILHVKHLRKKKSEDAKSTQALIDDELDEIQRIAETIVHCEEGRKQGDLRFGESEAVDALHGIAKRACSCSEGDPDVPIDPACPVHGTAAAADPTDTHHAGDEDDDDEGDDQDEAEA